jgi:putative transposase
MELSYPTDLTEEQWEILSQLLPPAKPGGRPRSVPLIAIVNAIFGVAEWHNE